MAEYIEREKLISDIDAAMENAGMGYVVGQTMKRYVKRITAANVAPVRHGRWERDEWGSYLRRCSVCKKSPVYKDERGIGVAVYAGVCINCGAKMDLEVSK